MAVGCKAWRQLKNQHLTVQGRGISARARKESSLALGRLSCLWNIPALHHHLAKLEEWRTLLQLRKLRLREVADLPRVAMLVWEASRTQPWSLETKFSFWPHCPDSLLSNSVTQVICSMWSNAWPVFSSVIRLNMWGLGYVAEDALNTLDAVWPKAVCPYNSCRALWEIAGSLLIRGGGAPWLPLSTCYLAALQ